MFCLAWTQALAGETKGVIMDWRGGREREREREREGEEEKRDELALNLLHLPLFCVSSGLEVG